MIEVIDVHKSFGGGGGPVEALRGLTFRLPRGSNTFIVGPSGSGKSTLLYLIGALDRPTSGTIRVGSRNVTAMTESEQDAYRRDRVGFVYQSFNLIANLSSVDNVLLPHIPCGVTPGLRAKAEGLLRQVGMGRRLKHRPHQLSGGQQQRVAVARAIVGEPRIVLGDEPTGNLDSRTSVEIMALFQSLGKAGMTVVLVTHEPDIAAYASRVLIMRDGRVLSDERRRPIEAIVPAVQEGHA